MENIAATPGGGPVARSTISVEVNTALRSSLRRLAAGRILVIDSFRSWCCGTWIGDLTVEWWTTEPDTEFVELAPIEGIRLFAKRRLLGLIGDAGVVLRWGRFSFRRGLAVELRRPELWIDYLDHPARFDPPEGVTPTP